MRLSAKHLITKPSEHRSWVKCIKNLYWYSDIYFVLALIEA